MYFNLSDLYKLWTPVLNPILIYWTCFRHYNISALGFSADKTGDPWGCPKLDKNMNQSLTNVALAQVTVMS